MKAAKSLPLKGLARSEQVNRFSSSIPGNVGGGRWVNCLLIREIPFSLAMRLWDTYLAEGVRMKEYLTYVLAAFLLTWSADLKRMDFQVRHCSVMSAAFLCGTTI